MYWDTEAIQRAFNVPKGSHPAIVKVRATEIALTAGSNLTMVADTTFDELDSIAGVEDGSQALTSVFIGQFNNDSWIRLPPTMDRTLHMRNPASGADTEPFPVGDDPAEPVEIRNHLLIFKSQTASWGPIIIDYILVLGDLDWASEMAELLGQIRQISPERSAGGSYFQPTSRFRQVGGLGAPDHGDG